MSLVMDAPIRSVVRQRDLRLLLAAALVSQTGDWVLATGVGFQVYALTGSALASAAILIATQLPQVLLGSVAGVVVDRRDRRRTMIAVDLALAVVLLPLLVARDAASVPLVVAVVAVSSCLTPFFVAAEASLLPALVPEERLLVTTNAVNGQIRNVARLLGATLGGIAVGVGGFPLLAIADLVTFAAAALLLGLIRHRPGAAVLPRLRPVHDWVEGLAVIRRSRALVVLLLFFALSGVGEAVMGTLFAPFVQEVLGGDAQLFGAINAAQAVGGIAGGLAVAVLGHRLPPRLLLGVGALFFGLGDAVLFLFHLVVPAAWPAVLVIALVGLPGAALSAGMQTVFQVTTDAADRGRVFGALITAQNLAMLSGSAIAGALADGLGVLPVITVQAAVYVIGGAMVLRLLPRRAAA